VWYVQPVDFGETRKQRPIVRGRESYEKHVLKRVFKKTGGDARKERVKNFRLKRGGRTGAAYRAFFVVRRNWEPAVSGED